MKQFCFSIYLFLVLVSAGAQELQPKKIGVNGTGLSIVLPDTSFTLVEDDEGPQYTSKTYQAFIGLTIKSAAEEQHSFDETVRLWRLEMGRPNSRLAKDTAVNIDGFAARIFKTEILSESSGAVRDIFWTSMYDFNGKPLVIMGAYPVAMDALLSPAYLNSFLSLAATNTDSIKSIFKFHFNITTDYAPLKFGGYMLGGYALSETGKYPKDGELQCIIVPYNNMEVKDGEVLRDLLSKRLFLREKKGESLTKYFSLGFSTVSHDPRTTYCAQDVLDVKDEKKIVFLAIKTDQYGYFEIWGEAYGDKREEYVALFRKIAESIKRDGE